MTNIIVKSYTVLYICMEVMICQSQRSPEIFMISQTHRIGETSKHITQEKACGGNSSSFWITFAKPFLLKIEYSKMIEIW